MGLPVDIALVIKLHHDQAMAGTLMVNRLRLLTNRSSTLIHLATLIAFNNDLKEDEWPNFEFYPSMESNVSFSDKTIEQVTCGGIVKPFRFKMSIQEIL